MSHTPAPWAVGKAYVDDEGFREVPILAVVDGKECYPASVCIEFRHWEGMQDANARLIAASPVMLAALRTAALALAHASEASPGMYLKAYKEVSDAIELAVFPEELRERQLPPKSGVQG